MNDKQIYLIEKNVEDYPVLIDVSTVKKKAVFFSVSDEKGVMRMIEIGTFVKETKRGYTVNPFKLHLNGRHAFFPREKFHVVSRSVFVRELKRQREL